MVCLVKRSQALRARNLTRDSQADGAPMVPPTLGRSRDPESLFGTTRTPEPYLSLSWGLGQRPQESAAHAQTPHKTLNYRDPKPLRMREHSQQGKANSY